MRRLHPSQVDTTPATIAGTTLVIEGSDVDVPQRLNGASPVNVIAPSDADADIAIGDCIPLYQFGTGSVIVVPGAGAAMKLPALNRLAGQYYGGLLYKVAPNTYLLLGGVE